MFLIFFKEKSCFLIHFYREKNFITNFTPVSITIFLYYILSKYYKYKSLFLHHFFKSTPIKPYESSLLLINQILRHFSNVTLYLLTLLYKKA